MKPAHVVISVSVSGMDPHKAFNHAFKTFIRDLIRAYPDTTEFKLIHGAYKVLKTINDRLVYVFFQRTLGPYEEHILRRDDTVFMAPDFTVSDEYRMMLPMLVNVWKSADEDNRTAVWNHMAVLIELGRACAAATRTVSSDLNAC